MKNGTMNPELADSAESTIDSIISPNVAIVIETNT